MWTAAEPPPGGARCGAGAWLRLLFVACLALWLAACVTPRAPRSLLPLEAQQALLRDLAQFTLAGKVSVTAGQKREIARLDWTQHDEAARIRLSGPFGAGALTVDYSPQLLKISSGGETYEGADAEALLRQEIGGVPPFEVLRFWILGLEAPGEAPAQRSLSADGRLEQLTQRDWNIRYDRWMPVAASDGGVELPARVNLRRDDLALTVSIERWKL